MPDRKRRPQGSGGLRRRGESWQSTITDPRTGRTRYRTWPSSMTVRQVERAHADWVADVRNRRAGDRQLTVGQYLERWLERRPDMSPQTLARHTTSVRAISRQLGAVRLAELDGLLVAEMLTDMRRKDGRPVSAATVKAVRSTLSSALADAVAWGLVSTNVAQHARLPRAARTTRATPTTEQVHALCDGEPDPLWRTLWEVLAGTGCRPGEALALRWGDVDLPGRSLTIARTMTVDRRSITVVGDRTKTGTVRRVTIDEHLVGVLAGWRAVCAGHDLAMAKPEAHLFASQHSRSGVVSSTAVGKAFLAAVERVGADTAITPHAVRHWFASTLMADGVPAQLIAAQLGHSINEVQSRYGAHAPAHLMLDVASRMPARTAQR